MNPLIKKIKSLKDIFENLPVCTFIKDTEGRMFYMNPAFVRFTGYSPSEMLYETADGFMTGNTIQLRESIRDDGKILSGETDGTERLLFLKNALGESKAMRLMKIPLQEDKAIIGILCVAEDVSDNFRLHYIGIERAIMRLSPGERMVVFQYSRGLSRPEVARALKLHPSAADTTWQRAREKLKLSGSDLELFLRFYNDLIDNIYP